MAEVIGIVASAAALIQLVRYGKKSAHALYGFSRRAGISKIDVERCANHVRTFSLTVGLAHEALEEYGTDPSASPVFEFISSRKVLSAISIDSESLVSRLTLAVKRFRGLAAGGRTPMAFIKWWLHKDDVMALFPEMERIKTNLMLIIAVIQLKMLYIKPKTEPSDSFGINKLEQRAKRLKSNIKTQLDTMAKLEEQIERAHQRRDSIGQQPPTAPVNLSYEALSQLGKSILNTGDVPSTPPASPGPSSPSSSTTGLAQSISLDSVPRTRFPTRNIFVPSPQPPNPPKFSQRPATSKILKVDRKHHFRSVTGYNMDLKHQRPPQFATAVVNDRLDGNIISILEVQRLGFTNIVPNDEDEEEVRIVFDGTKPQRCLGKVKILWSEMIGSTRQSQLVTLQLCVVEHCSPRLIFGRPFIQATEEQQRRRVH